MALFFLNCRHVIQRAMLQNYTTFPFHSHRQMVGQSSFPVPSSYLPFIVQVPFCSSNFLHFLSPLFKMYFYGTDYSKDKLLIHFEEKGFVSFFKVKIGASKHVKLFWLLGNIKTSSIETASWYSHYGKVLRFLKQLKIDPPHNPAVLLLGMYLNSKTLIWKGMCTRMFIAALFTTGQLCRQT